MNQANFSGFNSLNSATSSKKSKKFRTPLKDRSLPFYTKGEEILNTLSHTIGAALGIAALVLCVVFTALRGNVWGTVAERFTVHHLLFFIPCQVYITVSNQDLQKK
jgi:predicted membrane channel-forming protein YqfA (hemolysin III family)